MINAQSAEHGQSLTIQTSTCPPRLIGVVMDNLTVSLLFVVWIREFHSWLDDFTMASIVENKRT